MSLSSRHLPLLRGLLRANHPSPSISPLLPSIHHHSRLLLLQPRSQHQLPLQQQQSRCASTDFMSRVRAKKREAAKATAPKKRRTFRAFDMKDAIQWSLCDAMRYIRAFEVGRDLDSVKYEIHIRLKTRKNGAVIRSNINLPHAFQPQARICVICPPGSRAAKQAAEAGAELIGEEEVFEKIRKGELGFEKCICHTSSLAALNKAQLGRILGPKGLMPSIRMGTVTDNIANAVSSMRVGSAYRERMGVIRMGIGRLGFSPEMLRDNISTLLTQLRKDTTAIADENPKDIAEVVLSSTHAPGFSLNGDFRSDDSPPSEALTGH